MMHCLLRKVHRIFPKTTFTESKVYHTLEVYKCEKWCQENVYMEIILLFDLCVNWWRVKLS